MKENLKKLAKYYKPYLGTFIIDMILAMMSAAVALVIPLVVRYITSKVAYMPADEASKSHLRCSGPPHGGHGTAV